MSIVKICNESIIVLVMITASESEVTMIRTTFIVFGKEGHRQRASFGKSFEFNTSGGDVHIECLCKDRTFVNSFVEVIITADSFRRCAIEFNAQLSDGIFESCEVGKIIIQDIEKEYTGHFKSIKAEIEDVIEFIK